MQSMANPPTRATGPYRPTRIGQWEVIAKIAGGGMSAVYLGRRVEPTFEGPNTVALKIMRHDIRTDDRLAQMFLAEGKLISRLIHRNIVRTLEVGADAEQDFIAMELMLGKTFSAIQEEVGKRAVRLNPLIAAWTAARIADALHFAHELADDSGSPLKLVHRDVNPANVFATFDGEVKLFDFGLAKVTAGDGSGTHMLAGKLSYLSPEQIMQMPLDRRSDIFSLGTTLWELLTARRLFRRDSDRETVRAVQLGPIPDPRSIAGEVPEELARITRAALERNREHRYPTALHLARELDAFVFSQTSAKDVTERLAGIVAALFPEEQKRQAGWLKAGAMRAGAPPPSGFPAGSASAPPGPLSLRTPGAAFSPLGRTWAQTPPSSASAVPPSRTAQVPAPFDGSPVEIDVSGFGSSTDIQARPPLPEIADDTDAIAGFGAATERDLPAAAPAPPDPEDFSETIQDLAAAAPRPQPSPSHPPPAFAVKPRIPLPSKSAPPPRAPSVRPPENAARSAEKAPPSDTKIDLPAPPRKG